MAQTGDRISSIAARYAGITAAELQEMTDLQRRQTAGEIRSMAMSLLRQDEVRGLRKLVNRLLGK